MLERPWSLAPFWSCVSIRKEQMEAWADFLAPRASRMRIDAAHAIAHNKVMVIDGSTVIGLVQL